MKIGCSFESSLLLNELNICPAPTSISKTNKKFKNSTVWLPPLCQHNSSRSLLNISYGEE